MYCYECMNKLDGAAAVCPFCGKETGTTGPVHHLRPGTMLAGRYIIGKSIGEGGFGITYIGRDTKLDMRVAVKEFFLAGMMSRMQNGSVSVINAGDNVQRFRHGKEKFLFEARNLAMFSGTDGVVDVRDFFEENDTAYIVMEYLEGQTLSQIVNQNGRLPLDQTVELLTPVMQALSKIHAQGLIHRDIGPDNIMLTQDKVKLLDFGSARDIDSGSNTVIVKPGFAPEEQYRAESDQSAALDVYSLSATIYFCITGIVPPAGITRLGNDTLQAPSQCGAAISSACESVILKGMSLRAQDRYQSIAELQDALNTALKSPTEQDPFKTVYADVNAVAPETASPSYRSDPPSADKRDYTAPAPQKNAFATPQKKAFTEPQQQKVSPQNKSAGSADLFNAPKNQAPVKKKGSKLKKILIGVAVFLVVVIVGTILIANFGPKLQMTTVNGEDVKKDSETYSFRDTTVTSDMISEVDSKIKNLNTLYFYSCMFDPGAFNALISLDQVETMDFTTCLLTDYSFLSQMPNVKHLGIRACDLTNDLLAGIDFSKFTELKTCCLTGNTQLSDLSPLSAAGQTLTAIEADATAVGDLSVLGKMEMVYKLSFNQCKISNLSSLGQNFPNVQSISLAYNEISDLTGMENMAELSYLTLAYNQITDLSPLSTDKALYQVYFNNNQITDITPLQGHEALYLLNLEENKLEKVAALADSTKLSELYLKNNKIDDLSGLETCIHLKHLSVPGNRLTDISPLKNTTLLESLSLSDNQITDLSPLANTAGALKSLYFDHNNVEDISVLKGASLLEYVSFDGNQVSDISALGSKSELAGISAEQNAIVSIDALAGSPKLNYIYLAFNQIEDISPLSGSRTNALDSDNNQAKMVINLSNNRIKKLSFASNANYSYLAIHGNPIDTITNFPEEATYLSISYYEGLDPDTLANSTFNKFQVVDCPLDKQVSFEESLNKSFKSHVSFATEEEANAEIAAQKHSLLYGESADDPSTIQPTETVQAAETAQATEKTE